MKVTQKRIEFEAIKWEGESNCEAVFEFLGWEHPEDEMDHSLINVSMYPNGVLETETDWSVENQTVEVEPGMWFLKDAEGRIRVVPGEMMWDLFEEVPEGAVTADSAWVHMLANGWPQELGETRTNVFQNGVDAHVSVVHIETGRKVEMHGSHRDQTQLVMLAKAQLARELKDA